MNDDDDGGGDDDDDNDKHLNCIHYVLCYQSQQQHVFLLLTSYFLHKVATTSCTHTRGRTREHAHTHTHKHVYYML
jgi:hypothetical protein